MGHDSERAAIIYQHAAQGADQAIAGAMDAHVEAKQAGLDTGPGLLDLVVVVAVPDQPGPWPCSIQLAQHSMLGSPTAEAGCRRGICERRRGRRSGWDSPTGSGM
jgi:hypothetical protein